MTQKRNILVMVPTRGNVPPEHVMSLVNICRYPNIEIAAIAHWTEDLVKLRNRALHHLANDPMLTHLVMIDSDISFTPEQFIGLVQTDKDCVGAPYPRRLLKRWDKNENLSYDYAFFTGKETKADELGCAEVDWVPTGFICISRELAIRAISHYRAKYKAWSTTPAIVDAGVDIPIYIDSYESKIVETVGVFNHLVRDMRQFSEDISFCMRLQEMGEKVHMYCNPVNHHGMHTFKGSLEGLTNPNNEP
jgi:hypothetical protein